LKTGRRGKYAGRQSPDESIHNHDIGSFHSPF
jgi:hypothetical protein